MLFHGTDAWFRYGNMAQKPVLRGKVYARVRVT